MVVAIMVRVHMKRVMAIIRRRMIKKENDRKKRNKQPLDFIRMECVSMR